MTKQAKLSIIIVALLAALAVLWACSVPAGPEVVTTREPVEGAVRGVITVPAGTATPIFSSDNNNCPDDWTGVYDNYGAYTMGHVDLDEATYSSATGSCKSYGDENRPEPNSAEPYAFTYWLQAGAPTEFDYARLSFDLRFEAAALAATPANPHEIVEFIDGIYYTANGHPACDDDFCLGESRPMGIWIDGNGRLAIFDDAVGDTVYSTAMPTDTWMNVVLEAFENGSTAWVNLLVDETPVAYMVNDSPVFESKKVGLYIGSTKIGEDDGVSEDIPTGSVWIDDVLLWLAETPVFPTPTPTATATPDLTATAQVVATQTAIFYATETAIAQQTPRPAGVYVIEVLSSQGPTNTPRPTRTPTPTATATP